MKEPVTDNMWVSCAVSAFFNTVIPLETVLKSSVQAIVVVSRVISGDTCDGEHWVLSSLRSEFTSIKFVTMVEEATWHYVLVNPQSKTTEVDLSYSLLVYTQLYTTELFLLYTMFIFDVARVSSQALHYRTYLECLQKCTDPPVAHVKCLPLVIFGLNKTVIYSSWDMRYLCPVTM